MIIDLIATLENLRIRTRSTMAVRHTIDLVRALLEQKSEGAILVHRRASKPLAHTCEVQLLPEEAVRELIRWTKTTHTDTGLDCLVR